MDRDKDTVVEVLLIGVCSGGRQTLPFPDRSFPPFPESNYGEIAIQNCQNFTGLFLSKHTPCRTVWAKNNTLLRQNL